MVWPTSTLEDHNHGLGQTVEFRGVDPDLRNFFLGPEIFVPDPDMARM